MLNLNKINENSHHYVNSISVEFNKACEPILQMHIPWFGYMRIFEDGSYLFLINNPNLHRAYISNIKNMGFHFSNEFNMLSSNKSYYYLIPSDIRLYDEKRDPIMHLLYNFDIWHNFSVYKLKTKFVDCYCFGGTRESQFLANYYINNISLLENFITHFDKFVSVVINFKDKKNLSKFDQIFTFNKIIKSANHFIEDKYNNNIKLSNQEYQCLRYLSMGYSYKEVGSRLSISARTVENYLNMIKNKTGYYSKSELVTNFLSNKGLLDKI